MGRSLVDKEGDVKQLDFNNLSRFWLCNPVSTSQLVLLKDELLRKVIRRNEIHHTYFKTAIRLLEIHRTQVTLSWFTICDLYEKLLDVNNKISQIEIKKYKNYIGAVALIENRLLEQGNKEMILKDFINEVLHTVMNTTNINNKEIEDNRLEYNRKLNLY